MFMKTMFIKRKIIKQKEKTNECCESEFAQMVSKSHLATLGGEELMATKRSSWF